MTTVLYSRHWVRRKAYEIRLSLGPWEGHRLGEGRRAGGMDSVWVEGEREWALSLKAAFSWKPERSYVECHGTRPLQQEAEMSAGDRDHAGDRAVFQPRGNLRVSSVSVLRYYWWALCASLSISERWLITWQHRAESGHGQTRSYVPFWWVCLSSSFMSRGMHITIALTSQNSSFVNSAEFDNSSF